MNKIHLCFVLFCLIVVTPLESQTGIVKQSKLTDFELQSSALVSDDGDVISRVDYKPDIYWFPVKVPSTVLTGLVANGVYPDPYQGLNNMYIPDASDEFNKEYDLEKFSHLPGEGNPWKKPYWYRTKFRIDMEDEGRSIHLVFKGINYRAAVWVNGSQVSDSTMMAGMFAQYSYNITDHINVNEDNVLAVKIYPLDYPGLPSREQLEAFGDFYPNGGPTGDIGKNVTMLCSVGWDWIPPVRDRNIGIWLPVYLRITGGVTFSNPKLVTDIPDLPDTTLAELSLELTLVNHTDKYQDGSLKVTILPENFEGTGITFTRKAELEAGEKVNLTFDKSDTGEMLFKDPALWWPNGYGRPNLYRIRLQYLNNAEIINDSSFVFGIRTVSTGSEKTGDSWRRDFYVNGRRIQLTGGAWVPDMMLNRDSARYDHEMHLIRNSNVNLVRIWGGGVTPCDEFFDAADRYGLLVWSDFWITGDTQGEFKGSPDWPLEGEVFKKNVLSTVYRIRNHPSLLVWTGGNEGHARRELYDYMRNSIIELDGTRPFIPSSSGFARLPEGWPQTWPDNNPTGVYSGGPYTWQDPVSTYKRAMAGRDWVFKDETGLPSMVPYNILPKVIPNLVWDKNLPFPLNHTWGYHDAATGNGKWNLYYDETIKRYGDALSMEDFCNKTQLMNAEGYQGIFEAAGHKLNDIGGIMLWKLNAAFPSVVWQVYDWYLQPNAGYYFMQNACEPVHIQLNPVNHKVTILNRTYNEVKSLTADVRVYDMNSGLLFKEELFFSLSPSQVKETASLSRQIKKTDGITFVVMNIKDAGDRIISHNASWLKDDGDFRSLNKLPGAIVNAEITGTSNNEDENKWSVEITNPGDKIAFFIRLQLMAGEEEILPSFWSGNYVTLAPSETLNLNVSCPAGVVNDMEPYIKVSGWNVDGIVIK